MNPLIESLKGKLIVSCQAYVGEPMRHPETMAQVALSAERGGAAAIRCQGLADKSTRRAQQRQHQQYCYNFHHFRSHLFYIFIATTAF